jgi:hypothetical protein
MWATLVPLCSIGLVLGWRTFLELEVPDGPAAAVHLELPRTSAVATSSLTRRHPLVLLALKELRLQQLAWTLALIYALLYVGLGIWRRGTQEADTLAQALTMFFAAVIAIVLGAVTTAEERQLGTHDANLLQPVPAWQQWTVKAGTALLSAAVLTILLPVALVSIMPPEHMDGFSRRGLIQPHMIWLVAFVVAVSTYVSALSQTTMRALVLTIAVLVSAAFFFQRVMLTGAELAWRATHNAVGLPVLWSWLTRNQQFALWSVFIAGLVLMILWFAADNHRRADRGLVRIALQVVAVALVAVAGFTLAAALGIR